MFGNDTRIIALSEIRRSYPDEWVAVAVQKTDADGLPSAGQVLAHNVEERVVWSALKLGDGDDLIHVFFTGSARPITVAA